MNASEDTFSLAGKTAIVTGASYGLGVTLASGLANAGASLVLAARSEDKLRDVAALIEGHGGTAVPVACDVSSADQVEELFAKACRRFDRVDVVVNNAGIIAEAGMMPERVMDEAFARTVQINLLGLWYCCRAAGERMLADGKGGSIINMASIAGLMGSQDGPPAYAATKAAVINLTKSLAVSWADRGVRVNALAPGWFPSEMTGPVFAIPGFREYVKNTAPMARTGQPEELVGPLLLLASEAGSFITGHTLVVDGGVSATSGPAPKPEAYYQLLAERVPGGRGRRIEPD